jgi:hypothetical protein
MENEKNERAPYKTYVLMCQHYGFWAIRPPTYEYEVLTLCKHPDIHVRLLYVMTPMLVRVRVDEMNIHKMETLKKLSMFTPIHNGKIYSDDGLKTNWFFIFEAEISNFCFRETTNILPSFKLEPVPKSHALIGMDLSNVIPGTRTRTRPHHKAGAPPRHQSRKLRPKCRRRCTHRKKCGGRK